MSPKSAVDQRPDLYVKAKLDAAQMGNGHVTSSIIDLIVMQKVSWDQRAWAQFAHVEGQGSFDYRSEVVDYRNYRY